MTDKRFRTGDKVSWETPQGTTHGTVVEKLTSDARVGNEGQKGTKLTASEDDPRYVVESEKSGKRAAHRPESLTRRD
jgi:Hypervirulence associated proteins TUDOR domain